MSQSKKTPNHLLRAGNFTPWPSILNSPRVESFEFWVTVNLHLTGTVTDWSCNIFKIDALAYVSFCHVAFKGYSILRSLLIFIDSRTPIHVYMKRWWGVDGSWGACFCVALFPFTLVKRGQPKHNKVFITIIICSLMVLFSWCCWQE